MKVIKFLEKTREVYNIRHEWAQAVNNNIVISKLEVFTKVYNDYKKAKTESKESYYNTILGAFCELFLNNPDTYIDPVIDRIETFEVHNKDVFNNLLLLGETKEADELKRLKERILKTKESKSTIAPCEMGKILLMILNEELENF